MSTWSEPSFSHIREVLRAWLVLPCLGCVPMFELHSHVWAVLPFHGLRLHTHVYGAVNPYIMRFVPFLGFDPLRRARFH